MKLTLITIFTLLITTVIFSQNLSITLLKPTGTASNSDKELLTEKIRDNLSSNTSLSLFVLKDTAIVLEEWKREISGAYNEESINNIGEFKASSYLLEPMLNSKNNEYFLTLKLIDIESGLTTESLTSSTVGSIKELCDYILPKQLDKILPTNITNESYKKTPKKQELRIRVYPKKSNLFINNKPVKTKNGVAKVSVDYAGSYQLKVELSGVEKKKTMVIGPNEKVARDRIYVYRPITFHLLGGTMGTLVSDRIVLSYGGEFGISIWDINYLGLSYYFGSTTNKGFEISEDSTLSDTKSVISSAMFTYLLKTELYNVIILGIGADVGVGYNQIIENYTDKPSIEKREFQIGGPVARIGLGYDFLHILLQSSYNYTINPEDDSSHFVFNFNLSLGFTF